MILSRKMNSCFSYSILHLNIFLIISQSANQSMHQTKLKCRARAPRYFLYVYDSFQKKNLIFPAESYISCVIFLIISQTANLSMDRKKLKCRAGAISNFELKAGIYAKMELKLLEQGNIQCLICKVASVSQNIWGKSTVLYSP